MADPLGDALTWLDAHADLSVREQMGPRYGIHTDHAVGVAMRDMKALAKQLGTDHDLARDLWATGGYEARTVAALVDDPGAVTGSQMDAWAGDFDNWAICDTVCFNLFDRTAAAWAKVEEWADDEREFVRRGSFALLWALALHDRSAPDASFEGALVLLERGAFDERPLVNKAVIMAMRAVAKKRPALVPATLEAAERLAGSESAPTRRVGRAVVRDLR